MAAFPTYAKISYGSYSETRESALMRTEMESGPPKQARIKSRVLTTKNVSIMLNTKANYLSFTAWYRDTIHDGADWFTFTDPVSGSTVNARFAGGGFDATSVHGTDMWSIKSKIEVWS